MELFFISIFLLDELIIILVLNIGYILLYNVVCFGDDKIWISGIDNIMRFYIFKG